MRVLPTLSLILVTLLCQSPASSEMSQEEGGTDMLQQIVGEQRGLYNRQFEEIQFVFLEGGEDWHEDVCTLNLLLGHQPSCLTYEHPPDLRQDLMDASLTVLIQMLRNEAPYSALFKADSPLGWRETICAVSLNPSNLASSDQVASAYLFDLDAEQAAAIPQRKQLEARQFLHYLIDHEIYHCLDSFYNGPQPMSNEELWGEYYNFRRENGADAYALAMNIKRQGRVGDFARVIQDFRGMTIYQGDPDHWSYDAISRVLQLPASELKDKTPRDLFKQASRIRDSLVGDYPAYLTYRATAMEALLQLRHLDLERPRGLSAVVDPDLLKRLIGITNRIKEKNLHLAE